MVAPELMPHTICVGRDLKGLWAGPCRCGQGAPLGLVQQSHFLKPGILFQGCVLSWIRFHEKLLLVCRTGGKTHCPLPPSAATNTGWVERRCPSFTVGLVLIQPSKLAGSLTGGKQELKKPAIQRCNTAWKNKWGTVCPLRPAHLSLCDLYLGMCKS